MEWQCLLRYSSAILVLTWFSVLSAHYIKDQAKLAAVNSAMATMREAYEILSNPATPSFIKVSLHGVQSFKVAPKRTYTISEVYAMSTLNNKTPRKSDLINCSSNCSKISFDSLNIIQ